jgi:hypothetical protein
MDMMCDHNNNEAARKRARDRTDEATQTREQLERSKKLTSGKAFKRGWIGLHQPEVLEHQLENLKLKTAKDHSDQGK